MAPSRRKGASKAAAAAAARRQWKVGDLVLAKVKGFPAWPATVSEPEKWGYATDWKKVLVYFFGTQQIAFCNPADVEPFTEEKKQSLLIKRHGKGADFVRAVKEIVESYEKLKKQDQDDGFISEEVAHMNGGNSADSSSNVESKDQLEAPEATFDSQCKSSYSTADGNEPCHHAENALPTVHKDAVDGKEEPIDLAAVTEKPLCTMSRKRSKDLPLQNGVSQRKEASVRRSRPSSRLESHRLQGSAVHCNDSGGSVGDIAATVTRDGLLQRNKQKWKPRDASECDVDLFAFVSSGSTEDNGSEIVTIESDTLSFNEGSTIDSGCKIERSETLVGCVDGDVELGKGLDLQIKALVIKKKRKPNRKRPNNDAVEPTVIADKEAGVQNTSKGSQNACGKMNGGCPREDGDEHLPLVKRARVRMGESSLKEPNSLSNTEENTLKEATIRTSGAINNSLHCDDSTDRDSFVINAVMDASPSRGTQLHEGKPQLWKPKKDQSFVCSVDGEAALPPSKRLHRAFEAMSANAAEEGQSNNDVSLGMNTRTNVYSISPVWRSPDVITSIEGKRACEAVPQNVDAIGSSAQGVEVSEIATGFNTIAVENTELSQETGSNNKKIENSSTLNNKYGEECFRDDGKRGNEKSSCAGPSNVELASTAVPIQSPSHLSPGPDRKESDVTSVQGSVDELSLSMDKGNAKSIELINHTSDKMEEISDECICTSRSMDTVSDTHDDIVKVSPQCGTGVIQLKTESTVCENTRSSEPPLDDNREENYISEVVTEVINEQREEDPSSLSFANGHLDGSAIHSSPSLTDGGDSLAHASPPNTSLGHASASDDSSFFQNNGSCSPDVHLHDKITVHPPVVDEGGKFESVVTQRPKSLGKYAESNAALSSFEAMLGTLTRTKESIGRATRVAVDCAKFGVSSKIVDVLARCLETESSLHRRVDLFFLVDSIVKGDVGGRYTSAIQAMLPRLLAAAAPPGSSALENRRQCLKVLRLWLERKILPESSIRRHMRELDSYGGSSGAFSRRSMRTERSLDDPLREMEGMLVDEYGSNSSFQLPGFCMLSMLKDDDEGSDSDGESFEAVTPEHSPEKHEDKEQTSVVEKHRHILEDVDGELEMEDVAPSCETELTSSSGAIGAVAGQISQNRFESNISLPFAPPLPQDMPPSSPPLPSSPPPPPPPPLPPAMHPPCVVSARFAGVDSKLYADAHNMQDTIAQSVAQQSNAPRINHYHPSECSDRQQQMPESFPGPNFYNKGYPVRPPQPPPSNQFSYVREEHFKARQDGAPPPPYSNRHHFVQNWDRENFHNHERRKQAPHDHHDSWRFPPHSFSGPPYPGKEKSYGPVPFVGPLSEQTVLPDQGWRFPPRSMSHRNSMPFRPPPLEGPIPVSSRGYGLKNIFGSSGPGFWRPR